MDVLTSWEELLAYPEQRIVVAIGNFDGLHAGHRRVLEHARTMAADNDGHLCVLTFHSNTRSSLQPHGAPEKLMRNEERFELLESYGTVCCAEIPFTTTFSEMEPVAFLEGLCGGREWFGLVVGDDFAFGRGRTGNRNTLRMYASSHGGAVDIVPRFFIDGERVSSTWIRKLLLEGNVEKAAILLGRTFTTHGVRVRGDAMGRKIGYPTVNLTDIQTLIPAPGVYATRTSLQGGIPLISMSYVGSRPTLKAAGLVVETNILDFSGSVTPEEAIVLHWEKFIRQDIKFDGLNSLQKQLKNDEEAVRAFFQLH